MRGGWDKLKSEAEIQAALDNGSFMDLLRYKSGSGESEDCGINPAAVSPRMVTFWQSAS